MYQGLGTCFGTAHGMNQESAQEMILGVLAAVLQHATAFPVVDPIAIGKARYGLRAHLEDAWETILDVVPATDKSATSWISKAPIASGELLSVSLDLCS